jgi:branched-chain amino acid transport system substrate-binding protein
VDYIQASGGAAEGTYVTFLVPDVRKLGPATAFVKAFEANYGTLSSYGPLAYEAANILLTAIQKVGKPDRAAIRDAVRATSDFNGILGFPLTFDDKGDVKGANVYIYQVKGDGFVQLKAVQLPAN